MKKFIKKILSMLLTCCCIFSVAACDGNGNNESKQNSESQQNSENAQESAYSSVMCSHVYTSTITMEPTCGKAGIKTYTCRFCNDSYTEEIAKLTTHSYTKKHKGDYSTFTGTTIYTCSVCGDSYTETFQLPVIKITEPTCCLWGENYYKEYFQTCILTLSKFAVDIRFKVLSCTVEMDATSELRFQDKTFDFYISVYNDDHVKLATSHAYTATLSTGQRAIKVYDVYLDIPMEAGKTYTVGLYRFNS